MSPPYRSSIKVVFHCDNSRPVGYVKMRENTRILNWNHTELVIGLYRENAIVIESEARVPFGGNVYYVTMQITFPIPEYTTSQFRSAHAHARSRADLLRSTRITSTARHAGLC